MTKYNDGTNYLEQDEPELYDWLGSSASGNAGHEFTGMYRGLIQRESTQTYAPIFKVFDNNASLLFDTLAKAECYAMLTELPEKLLAERQPELSKLRPRNSKKSTAYAKQPLYPETWYGLRDGETYPGAILNTSYGLKTQLKRDCTEFEWRHMIIKDDGSEASLSPIELSYFLGFKERINQGGLPNVTFDESYKLLNRLEAIVKEMDKETTLTQPLLSNFGEDQEMMEKCHHYAQKTLYPELMERFARLRSIVESAEEYHDIATQALLTRMREAAEAPIAPQTPSSSETPDTTAVHMFQPQETRRKIGYSTLKIDEILGGQTPEERSKVIQPDFINRDSGSGKNGR